jgi:hypothetical protein
MAALVVVEAFSHHQLPHQEAAATLHQHHPHKEIMVAVVHTLLASMVLVVEVVVLVLQVEMVLLPH